MMNILANLNGNPIVNINAVQMSAAPFIDPVLFKMQRLVELFMSQVLLI